MDRLAAEPLLRVGALVGEGPRWDPDRQKIFWVDITGQRLHLTDPATGNDDIYHVPTAVGAGALRQDGSYLLALVGQLARWEPAAPPVRMLDLEDAHGARRPNDAAVDPAGRLLVGTVPTGHAESACGRLYQVDAAGPPRLLCDGLRLPNGLDWSPAGTTLYFTDSGTGTVGVYDYEPGTGAMAGPRDAVAIADGIPDGHTVDAEGNLWVAHWGAGSVGCYTPDGRLRLVVDVPVAHVTACAFVGANLDTLVITSMRDPDAGSEPGALDGAVFACTVPATGKLTARCAR